MTLQKKQLKSFKPDKITPLRPDLKNASQEVKDQYILVKLRLTKKDKEQVYSVAKHSVDGVTKKFERDGWKVEFLN